MRFNRVATVSLIATSYSILLILLRTMMRIASDEHLMRLDYEKALGISVLSDEDTEKDLWARAHQGDKIALAVLDSRLTRAASDELRKH